MTNDAKVISGAIPFQEVISATSKKGGEYTFRKDLLSLDLNDRINFTDIGAAMMRGFDIPAFRKDILREIRQTKEVPSIDQFWGNWLHQMSNAVRTIEGDLPRTSRYRRESAGRHIPMQVAVTESAPELVTA